MPDPFTELQTVLYAALKADPGVMALAYEVYDDTRLTAAQKAAGAPWGDPLGYISFGPEQIIDADVECADRDSVFMQLDVWSKQVGRLHCKALCGEVHRVVEGIDLAVNALGEVSRTKFQIVPDPADGITHGILTYRFDVEHV